LAQIAHAQPPPDDTARFSLVCRFQNSPLASLTSDPTWQEHSANFEQVAKLNTRRQNRTPGKAHFPEAKSGSGRVLHVQRS
jgi:hypothetical protein